MPIVKRQIAYKTWINTLSSGRYVKCEGWDPNYVDLGDKQISRVNILATVVSKFASEDGNYAALTLDDGSDTIRVKAFGPDVPKLTSVEVGDIIRFVGKVKEYNEEIHLSPEVVRIVTDANWIIVWALELGKPKTIIRAKAEKVAEIRSEELKPKEEAGKSQDKGENDVVDFSEDNFSVKVLGLIKTLDTGKGADMKKVIEDSKLDEEEAKSIIVGLLKSGDVFEPKKGFLKAL